jgi:hypothetical protein
MDIGEEEETVTVEPVEDPVPRRDEPSREREPGTPEPAKETDRARTDVPDREILALQHDGAGAPWVPVNGEFFAEEMADLRAQISSLCPALARQAARAASRPRKPRSSGHVRQGLVSDGARSAVSPQADQAGRYMAEREAALTVHELWRLAVRLSRARDRGLRLTARELLAFVPRPRPRARRVARRVRASNRGSPRLAGESEPAPPRVDRPSRPETASGRPGVTPWRGNRGSSR